jgi:hypothetical protein
MPAIIALKDGMRRVNQAPVLLVCALAVTLLIAIPFSLTLRSAIQGHLGSSVAAGQVARGVSPHWWSEFMSQAGPLAAVFRPSIVGFAAPLGNLSTLLDGQARPAPILFLGGSYLLIWMFLSGGIIDRYARGRPTRAYEFFAACGVYFGRFLRLSAAGVLIYYVLFAYVHPALFDDVYGTLTRDETVERTAFLIRLGLYATFGVLLVLANLVFDYAKVRAVVEDRRSMLGALASSVRFVRRNFAAAATLYLVNGVLFLGILLLYALVAPGPDSTGIRLWIGFLISQLYLLARLWARLTFVASETSLFQARLAHTAYVGSLPVPRPEPPVVETLLKRASADRG